jgi:hypothetical protein
MRLVMEESGTTPAMTSPPTTTTAIERTWRNALTVVLRPHQPHRTAYAGICPPHFQHCAIAHLLPGTAGDRNSGEPECPTIF